MVESRVDTLQTVLCNILAKSRRRRYLWRHSGYPGLETSDLIGHH